MAKRKSKTTPVNESGELMNEPPQRADELEFPPQAEVVPDDGTAIEVTEVMADDPAAAEGAQAAGATSPESQAGANQSRPRFRSWVRLNSAGYERLSDDVARNIVIRFAEKPDAAILDQVKAAGFHYQPEYFGLEKVWMRRGDYEGRVQAEAIEATLRQKSQELA